MTAFDYDVILVGLGPAGATLAARMAPKLRVLALDKKQMGAQTVFRKPCGGMLAPDAQKVFSRFGMTLPKDVLVDPQIFSVRTIDLQSGLERHYQRHYINMDRHRFDSWLMGHIPSAVDVRLGAVMQSLTRRADGGFALTFSHHGSAHTVTARYAVGADGAASPVRRALWPGMGEPCFMAIQQWFEDGQPSASYACFFDSRLTPSYAWGLTKDGHYILGGAFRPGTARADFEALKARLGGFDFKLEHPLRTEACLVAQPFGTGGRCCGGGGGFLIGEAAGFISPTSLEGISYALESGWLLARALGGSGDPNRAYRAATRGIRLRLLAKRMKHPFMYAPALRRLVMQSGLSSIEMVD